MTKTTIGPPIRIPSDGDTFNAAAFNVAYCALADRTQLLELGVSWLGQGWFVVAAYCVGFAVMLGVLGWQPDARSAPRPAVPPPRVMVPIGMNPGAHA